MFKCQSVLMSQVIGFCGTVTYAENTQIIGALTFFVHLPHISCLCIYPKSEVVITKQNTFHFCYFRLGAGRGCSWADSGTGRVYCQQCCRGAHYHTIMNILVLTTWKWCGWLERFLISLLMTVLGSECGEQAGGLSRPDGLFETNTWLLNVE